MSLRAAGTAAATPPVLSTQVDVPAGGARTVVVSGRFADLALAVVADDLSAPPAGSTRVRVLAAASGAQPLDVTLAGGTRLAVDLPFGAAGTYVEVPAGTTGVDVAGARAEGPALELAAGSVVSVLVLDAPGGGLTLRAVVDAAGPAEVPAGAVEAGGGPFPPGAAVALVALTAGTAVLARRPRRLVPVVVAAVGSALLPVGGAVSADAAPLPVALQAEVRSTAEPVRVRVPAAGIDAALAAIGLDAAGALTPPSEPTVAGWHAGGPPPGGTGPAVLAGHVDWAGRPAAFAGLGRVVPGDEVLVDRADGAVVRFLVTAVERHDKDAFPTAAVYGPTPDAQLRLITCGGAFDRATGSYADNIVVFATEAPGG